MSTTLKGPEETVKNLEVLTRNLERTRSGADTLLNGANRNLEEVARKTTALLDTTSSKVESLDLENLNATLERLPPLLDKTDVAMANITGITEDTRKLSSQLFPLLPGFLSRSEELISSTDRLMNRLNSSWLLGGSAPPPLERTMKAGDSHD